MEKYQPSLIETKILLTIEYLNSLGYYPLPLGVTKILNGIIDEETIAFKECPTFQTAISYNSKKISKSIVILNRYNYVKKTFDKVTNELYLEITDKGKSYLLDFNKHHKINLTRHKKEFKVTIVKITK